MLRKSNKPVRVDLRLSELLLNEAASSPFFTEKNQSSMF